MLKNLRMGGYWCAVVLGVSLGFRVLFFPIVSKFLTVLALLCPTAIGQVVNPAVKLPSNRRPKIRRKKLHTWQTPPVTVYGKGCD